MRLEGTQNLDGLKDKILRFTRAETFVRIGAQMVLRLSRYMAAGAPERHKWANKLGAKPTGMLEFRPAPSVSNSRTGATIFSESGNDSATMVIEGVMGIGRAFQDLDIYPQNASALTVPINKAAYAKTVKDLRDEGWNIFRRGRTLVGNHGTTKRGNAVPLFALCGHVHISKDDTLLPSSAILNSWAISEAERELNRE